MGELSGLLNREGLEIDESKVDADALAGLLRRIVDNTISSATRQGSSSRLCGRAARTQDAIIEASGLRQITDTGAIERVIAEVMAANPGQLADYRSGKDKLFGFFVGQVMKATGGKANPAQVNELLKTNARGS